MKKIFSFLFLLLLLSGCEKKEEPKELEIEINDLEININEEAYNTDGIITLNNGDIVSEKEQIDTSKLGEQEITLLIKDNENNEKEYSYKINIIDTEKPIIQCPKEFTTTVGTKINLLKNVSATDNSNEKIKVQIEKTYNVSKAGTYTLYFVAKDSSGNEAQEEFTVTVKPKTTTKKSTTTETKNNNNTTDTNNSVNGTKTSKGYTITVKNGITYIDGILIANKTYALPSSYNPGLNSNVKNAANEMFAAAKEEKGYSLYIASGFRSYSTQNSLYNSYVKRDGKAAADTYSARPGHSEHQSGLAFDVCDSNLKNACINSNFNSTEQADWLKNNAHKYGFILRYPNGKTGETGYKYESWHFRYVGKDLASKLYNNGNWITLENYYGITSTYK